MSVARIDDVVARALAAWRPPPRLSLSEWADRYFVLSPETAAEPGRWHTLPYQREILDSITDPDVTQVTVMKSARVGYTLCMSAAIGYFMHHDPSSLLVVQPTVDDAKNFSKETIAPMLRDVPVLSQLIFSDAEERGKGPKDGSWTLTHKAFPGGILSLIGANSGAGFRRISRRVVMFDEVDAYPPSAGSEGDQIRLGIKRTEAFHNRKIIAGSTPLIAGASRIEEMFEQGDQRRYYVPCPQCGHMDYLTFREGDRGHFMRWDDGKPETAYFVCRRAGCVIEHRSKRWMVERGEWRPERPESPHRSYHLWSALSYSPNATWGHIAADFLEAKRGGPERLRTFVNTTLGETWQERGDAPDWERLYQRREPYPIGTVPAGVKFLTCGVDVQKDRFVYEVVGWSETKESWSVDAGVLMGDTANETTWALLDELLARSFPGDERRDFTIAMLAIDSGYNTQQVYTWGRRHPMSRVIACKGMATERTLVGVASSVDITVRGKRYARGYRIYPVGVGIAKSELYGWLRLPVPEPEQEAPPGFCHFPEYGQEFFRQLTAEQLATKKKKGKGYSVYEWQLLPNRENHWLDARVYARVAANVLGLDRMVRLNSPAPRRPPAAAAPSPRAESHEIERPLIAPRRPPVEAKSSKGWLKGGRGSGWLGRRGR